MLAEQMLVESVLQRADVLLVGDPEVLAQLRGIPAAPGLASTPGGNAVVLHNPAASAFVWVAGHDQVTQVTVSLRLDALERESSPVGEIDCPSGRIVVGTPEAITAWGPEVEPADGLVAQARAYTPDRRHCGLIVVARVESGGRQVLAVTGDGGINALVVEAVSVKRQAAELLLTR